MRLLFAGAVASALSLLSGCDSSSDAPFSIDDVEYPEEVVSDGPRGDLTIYWSGNPALPVTAVYGPTEDGCPVPDSCGSREQTFQEQVNPFVFEGSPKCSGYTEPTVIGYEVTLTDANGIATDPFPVTYTCVLE